MRLQHLLSTLTIISLAKISSSFSFSGQSVLQRKTAESCSVRSSSHHPTSLGMAKEEETSVSTLPTKEQASKDPFMSQLSHAAEICTLLEELSSSSSSDDESSSSSSLASDLLKAQLSHSDGIRGFFATYLTGTTVADDEDIPTPLVEAMKEADMDLLVPLACMNVIMPTAMSSLHSDPELSANAAQTARRGTRILQFLIKNEDKTVRTNCEAILAAATTGSIEGERVGYWEKFFTNYGYGDQQKTDIAEAMKGLL